MSTTREELPTRRQGASGLSKAEVTAAKMLAKEVGLEYIDLDRYPLNAAAAALIPEPVARANRALAVGWKYGTPVVAVAAPDNVIAMDGVRTTVGRDIHAVVACGSQIDSYIDRMYGQVPAQGAPPAAPAQVAAAPVAPAPPAAAPAEAESPPPAEAPAQPAAATEADLEPPSAPASAEAAAAEGPVSIAWTSSETFENMPALAEVLLASGQVTRDEMEAALRESNSTGRSLGEILGELGLVSDEDLIRAMAHELGLEFVDLNEFEIDPVAVALIPESMARRHRVLAIGFRDGLPVVSMANPSDVFALDDLRTVLGAELYTVVSTDGQISDYIQRNYRHDEEADLAARTAAEANAPVAHGGPLGDLQQVVEDAPIVKYVNLILRQALNERASDIHIDPTSDDLRVRFRIDGVLHDVTRSPKAIQAGVISRLKVMASLDISEHRLPQDGRISLNAGNREIDLRVATLPTVHGEMITLRILDKANAMLDLGQLGFLPGVLERYETAYRKAYGTILVTGPTGSGKSTTLYATCNILNHPERHLVTVEDPVEYQLRGINQVQVNPKAGLGFAAALRSILRTDPDIILVGEIRDKETATIAIEAALTGHLLLSSLHTNDAAGTPMRLIEMGLEPYLVGSALDCVVAQRLARRLCDNCAEAHEPTDEELESLSWTDDLAPERGPAFRRAVGCQACSRTGFRGRFALHEIMLASEEIERLVISRATSDQIKQVAVEQGMTTLRQDGLRKAALGLTSLEEVLRVVA
jgi:type IV pilus assembly protein PilB